MTCLSAPDADARRDTALQIRLSAAHLAHSRSHPFHTRNTDEQANPTTQLFSFTKGLPHHPRTGLLQDPEHYNLFVTAIETADIHDIRAIPLGPVLDIDDDDEQREHIPRSRRFTSAMASPSHRHKFADVRAWESMAAGHAYDLQGPDAQAVTMPPAPSADAPELVAELSESYWMALLRDIPFSDFICNEDISAAIDSLNALEWICQDPDEIPVPERNRARGPYTSQTIFRGNTPGEQTGPYISQFLLVGTSGLGPDYSMADGYIQYGAMRMDQRVRVAEPHLDFMTTWQSWLDVQNGADCRGRETYVNEGNQFRFITTPRDLATYVHYDALYQAYLNACVVLLNNKVPFDSGLPFQKDDDIDKQQAFALFGPPHILTLVTEVATRALKAIRFQKYNVHRRLRPEALAGLIERYHNDGDDDPSFEAVQPLYDALDKDMLERVAAHNATQNEKCDHGNPRSEDDASTGCHTNSLLLPMAFPEGSPMHPSYGAGHAAVAGACTTILKAFFDHEYELDFAYVVVDDGEGLEDVSDELEEKLTVEGELNKVCGNISIGRNWAGVHYFTDYRESIVLGEKIAIGILEEQKLTYKEEFSMTVPLFDGSTVTI